VQRAEQEILTVAVSLVVQLRALLLHHSYMMLPCIVHSTVNQSRREQTDSGLELLLSLCGNKVKTV